MKKSSTSQTKNHCPIVTWGRSQQQMINTVNSLLTVKCHSCLYVNTRHKQKRTRSRVSSCFSHSTETGVIASTCTCRLHLSHTNRHRAKTKKKKTMTRIKSLKYTRMDWQTTAKVQSEHKQRLVKQVQTSAQYLREDECITFFLFTALVLSINLTKNIAVSTASWQNWAWSNPVAWLCCWKSCSSTGGGFCTWSFS